VGEHRDFKFRGEVDNIKSQPTDDKLSPKEITSHDQYKICLPPKISGMAKAKNFKFCTLVSHMKY